MRSPLVPLLQPDSRSQLRQVLSGDVVFHSPVRDYHGRTHVAHILTTIGAVMDAIDAQADFAAGNEVVTPITMRYQGRSMTGVLHETHDRLGRVESATLLLRPLSTLRNAITGMQAALDRSPLPSPQIS